ncbi:MAG: hypothetical protein ACR2PX_17320 [Endozoicomonas sp.]|uniref:hypothetical protein n=1 Tax=Endozoicomonas sp. TaxID=1892382 RepID=UPI003D9AEACE
MRFVYSLFLLALTCLTTTLSYASPTPEQSTLVFCAPKGTATEMITEMGVAKFDYRINPVEAAAIAQKTVSDFPTLPNVVCTGELSKIRASVKIDNNTVASSADQETLQKISDAFTRADLELTTLSSRDGYEFTYRTIPAEDTIEIFKRSNDMMPPEDMEKVKRSGDMMPPEDTQEKIKRSGDVHLDQKGSTVSSSGLSSLISRNTGMLLLIPPLVFTMSGTPEYTIYYVLSLAVGISFHQTGVWNSLTILAMNTAGIAAQAGLLYQQNEGADYDNGWETGGYAQASVKEEYQKLRTAKADHATVPITSWAVLSQQVAIGAFTVNSIRTAAAKYFGMTSTQAMGFALAQAGFNIVFERATGYPLEDWIPIFNYDENSDRISARNWPYYGKKFVATNFLMIGWAAKQSKWIAGKAGWIGGHLGKAATLMWKKKQK